MSCSRGPTALVRRRCWRPSSEQHLHVQWQRLLVPALRELSPTTQLIVATHSEAILDSALSYERFILVEDEDPRAKLRDAGEEEEMPEPTPPS
ncbi:hypothetical protein SCE1572_46270 [Sorangium cellulosum So0157-2]|uniref:ATPase AAA-type core domain-containing protein n=1 Tax=Sorangium cellulosum So0157-2 TaxID=1254432 RepID=S4YEH8_SORCE|nr:hypothetical protein SCE1572_46270 [Sorangium cellulosum So0157-2]